MQAPWDAEQVNERRLLVMNQSSLSPDKYITNVSDSVATAEWIVTTYA